MTSCKLRAALEVLIGRLVQKELHQADKSDPQLFQQLGSCGILLLIACPSGLEDVLAGALQGIVQLEQALDILCLLVSNAAFTSSRLKCRHKDCIAGAGVGRVICCWWIGQHCVQAD